MLPRILYRDATSGDPPVSFFEHGHMPRDLCAQNLLRFHSLKLNVDRGFHVFRSVIVFRRKIYEPVGPSRSAPATTGAGSPVSPNSENVRTYPDNRAGAVVDAADRRKSENGPPDHAVLNMTKEQLKAAPAFKFSR